MSQLAGKFAGILKVSIDSSRKGALVESLNKLSDAGIQVLVENASAVENAQGKHLQFELVGADRVGIVSEISQAFAEQGISIEEFETYCSSMPWSGDPLFEATGVLLAPSETDTKQLLDSLETIEDELGVDIKLSEQL